MDYCTVIDYREEEIHGNNNSTSCSLLWTIIPLSGQVSVLIECFLKITADLDGKTSILYFRVLLLTSNDHTHLHTVCYKIYILCEP